MTGHKSSDSRSSDTCDFCGLACESLISLKSDENPTVVLFICPDCEREQSLGGCDFPEDYFDVR